MFISNSNLKKNQNNNDLKNFSIHKFIRKNKLEKLNNEKFSNDNYFNNKNNKNNNLNKEKIFHNEILTDFNKNKLKNFNKRFLSFSPNKKNYFFDI